MNVQSELVKVFAKHRYPNLIDSELNEKLITIFLRG